MLNLCDVKNCGEKMCIICGKKTNNYVYHYVDYVPCCENCYDDL